MEITMSDSMFMIFFYISYILLNLLLYECWFFCLLHLAALGVITLLMFDKTILFPRMLFMDLVLLL